MFKRPTPRKRLPNRVAEPVGEPDPDTFLGKLMISMTREDTVEPPKFKYIPIADIDGYIEARKRRGDNDDDLEMFKEERPYPVQTTKDVQKWVCPVKFLDQVILSLTIKGTKIKANVVCPYEEMIPYCRNPKGPIPVEVTIRCMKRAGAPKQSMFDILEHHNKYFSKKNLEKEQVKLDKVFSKYNVKGKTKVFKPVKKKMT
jgi:hypothetical protein